MWAIHEFFSLPSLILSSFLLIHSICHAPKAIHQQTLQHSRSYSRRRVDFLMDDKVMIKLYEGYRPTRKTDCGLTISFPEV